ncbi:MAG TPA: hypothetical protein VNO33_20550 [Kofleriaceae bacterium]|nr:hypothetical protein [Kofleriaceae bacterium]
MQRLLWFALVGLLAPRAAQAAPPVLEAVDAPRSPIRMSAPAGWEVTTRRPRHRDLSTIAAMSPACAGGDDISVAIQLDQEMKRPEQLLADQYGAVKPARLRGWACVVRDSHNEVMCAGKVRGAPGILGVYFATTSAESYRRFGDPGDFTSRIAASISWKGKLARLVEWRRPATDAARSSCR